MATKSNNIVGITMGDPAGIGPEIVARALSAQHNYQNIYPIIVGSAAMIQKEIKKYDLEFSINIIEEVEEAQYNSDKVDILDLDNVEPEELQVGAIQARAGQAAYEYIKKATELALAGKIDAISTAPIHKEALEKARVGKKGCTEILGDLTNTDNPLTMFTLENLRIFFFTRHLSLKEAIYRIEKDSLINMTQQCLKELGKLGIEKGKFAIAGLNPHCSDGGLFGKEEQEEIIPAIQELQQQDYDIIGPIGADSVFHLANQNNWAGVLSLYHDQGHIAAKTLGFYRTVSVTLGLPFLRTSVDHGTAFDIAGQGKANPISMVEAIKKVAEYL